MVESIRELDQICQKPNYKTVGNWMVCHILRPAALPTTWLLLHTNVTANQVTFASLIVGLAGAFLLSRPSSNAFVAGVLLLQFWYYLDHVDGQIARYRKTVSLSGRFHDFMVHHVIHSVILFCLGFYCFYKTGWMFVIVLGFVGSMGIVMFNLINDVKCKTFIERLLSCNFLEIVQKETGTIHAALETRGSFLRKIFSLLHKSVEIHVLMNVLTFAAIFELLWPVIDTRFWLLLFYSFVTPILAITKSTYFISKKKIDLEFNSQFNVK